jgi:transcriptional regulator with XRE-family HTH domain
MTEMDSLPENLKLLCSYCPSVSHVCRAVGISRQQFTKYLSGKSTPSLSNFRKISDFFGIEETELLMPAREFRELIALRPPSVVQNLPSQDFISSTVHSNAQSQREIKPYLGYYYSHFIIGDMPDRINRALIHIYDHRGAILTQNFERYPENSDGAAEVVKYEGVALYNAERLFIYEKEKFTGKRIWQTVVYTADLKSPKYLSGLTMGVAKDSVREIACYRIIYNFLGREIDLRSALSGCGTFTLDSSEIPKYVRDRVTNQMHANETSFRPLGDVT